MSMDVLLTLHPDLQQIVDKQLASSMSTPQPVDMLELWPPPPPILLEQDLINKTDAVLLGPPPPPPPCSGRCVDCSATGAATVPAVSTSCEGQHVRPHRRGRR
jgi:hypothetical protein